MTDARYKILEDQLDEMVGRVAVVEEELRALRAGLTRPPVLEILQVEKSAFEPLTPNLASSTEQLRASVARMRALRVARQDELLSRLESADRLTDLTGQSLSDAWTKVAKQRSTPE